MKNWNDPQTYIEMIENPYESSKDVQDAIDGFMKDVAIARKKHRIADVAMVVEVPIATMERISVALSLGHLAKTASMFLGYLMSIETERVNKMLMPGDEKTIEDGA